MRESENLYNILIECGADFVLPFTWIDENGNPVNLTGAEITAQLRRFAEGSEYVDFVCTHNGAGGRITITLPQEATANIYWPNGVYDVFVTPVGGLRTRLLYGSAQINHNVTKQIVGSMMHVISIGSLSELPSQGISNRLYYVQDAKAFYIWNGTGYVGAIDVVKPVGEWNANTAYSNLNIVTRNGFAYIAKKNVPKGTPVTNTEYWLQITYGLRIGTVTPVETMQEANATITGIPTDPRLNLWLPRGKQGEKGTGIEDLGALAWLNAVDYQSNKIYNKPTLGTLSTLDVLDYQSNYLINKPDLKAMIARLMKFWPDVPWEVLLSLYLVEEILCLQDPWAEYVNTQWIPETVIIHNGYAVTVMYNAETESLIIKLNPQKHVPEAPIDDQFYVRQNGNWVPVVLSNL